ncbi:hypothetical protein SY83_10900 [Paenibacillus swuensis]|uniref:Uncharacterized protein n=1 Tax=Paenibacillus swuensis TaxID=1178515 RepID=A0A172TIB1_9BACL|nr:hypothetical protein [Paenibacillus swuensis]ANE46696.1 hypothetical protein SY83_10900 [Paenibacillus swuensis]
MKKIYSNAQREYLAAKELFEKTSKVMEAKIQNITLIREIQQNEMEKLVLETGFHGAFQSLTDAENALIDWSHIAIREEKEYKENVEHFQNMYANLHTNPQARATIIDLAMKLK